MIRPQSTIELGGISAKYIGIEILTAGDGTGAGRVGIAQVEFTTEELIPSAGTIFQFM